MDKPPQHPTANPYPIDRRKSVRCPIKGLVQFQWHARDGHWHDGFGVTRDIGKGGVFIESDSIPPIGSPLKLTVTLPSEPNPRLTLQLGGTGAVRHVGREPYPTNGFGASANFHVDVPMSTGNTEGGER